jgi:hypothetical protein
MWFDHAFSADAPAGIDHARSGLRDGGPTRASRRRIVADSTTVGGREVKDLLRAQGFEDRKYRIFVEYVRQWGFL